MPSAPIPYIHELWRKLIHVASLWIPVCYLFLNKAEMLTVLIPITGMLLILELLRRVSPSIQRLCEKYFGNMLRSHEKNTRFFGATHMLIAATLSVAIFPKFIALTALTILIVSDTLASLIGRRWGKHPLFGKSVEGTSAFFLSAAAIVFIFFFVFSPSPSFLIAGLLGAAGATFAELFSHPSRLYQSIIKAPLEAQGEEGVSVVNLRAHRRIRSATTWCKDKGLVLDDNFTIPIAAGSIMWLVSSLFSFIAL